MPRFLIIGAGPTGIGAAYRLKELGISDFLVVESQEGPGGLASSVKDAHGFTWDLGGHVHFSQLRYYQDVLKKEFADTEWNLFTRNTWIWHRNKLLPYPFQSNVDRLGFFDRLRCQFGLTLKQKNPGLSANFDEWISDQFGGGIANLFMKPYNRKVWSSPLNQMGFQWIKERVAPVQQSDSTWGPNNTFRFPKTGGTGFVWNRLTDRIGREKFEFHTPILSLQLKSKIVATAKNKISYSHLISTMPLTELVPLMEDVPDSIRRPTKELTFSTVQVIGIGLKGHPPASIKEATWIYFADPAIPFYRATVFSNYSSDHTPTDGEHWSLLLECSRPGKSEALPALAQKCVDALIRNGFITLADICSTWERTLPYGYPVPTLDRDRILSTVQPYLESLDIYSRGRFGGWKYEVSNQDHSFMQGVELVNRLVRNEPETIYI